MPNKQTNNLTPPMGKDNYEYKFKNGDVIDNRYKVVKPLGFGGFAEVYQCNDTKLNTPVAIKVVTAETLTDEVKEEARNAAALRGGSHIVQVYDFASPNERTFYLSMQLMLGGSLEERLDNSYFRRLPLVNTTLEILEQVGKALDYAHSKGIIHLDVKPSNILFDENGQTFLSDFGLAHLKEIQDAAKVSKMSLSLDGHISGTVPYMSPELVSEEEATYRTDIYTLGVVAYEMLTGQLPYRGRLTALLANIAKAEPIPPRLANPELPERVEKVLLKVLSKNPDDRYQSCAEFVKELQAAAEAYIQVETLYEEAIEAIQKQRWLEALEKLQEVEFKAPGHENARLFLRDVRDQIALLETYKRASTSCDDGGFQECLDTLNMLEPRISDYKPGELSDESELTKVQEARQLAMDSLTQKLANLREKASDLLRTERRKKAQELYEEAQTHFRIEAYEACRQALLQARELVPDMEDPKGLENEVKKILKRQQELRKMYDQAISFSKTAQWKNALEKLKELEKEKPDYKDVRQQLVTVEHMAELAELYQSAEIELSKQNFEEAIRALNRLCDLDRNRRYEAEKVDKLRTEVFDAWYGYAKAYLEQRDWDRSWQTLRKLQQYKSDYGDPDNIEVQAQLGEMYDRSVAHARAGDFADALTLWLTICEEAPDYDDLRDVALRAKRGLYNEAKFALERHRYQEALDLWEQIKAAGPGYPDDADLVAQARAGLEKRNKLGAFFFSIGAEFGGLWQKIVANWRRGSIVVGGILAIIVLILLISAVLKQCSQSPPTTTEPTATSSPTMLIATKTPTATLKPATTTPTKTPMPSDTPDPTATPTVKPSPTKKPARTPTKTPTPTLLPNPSDNTATALLNSGIYAASSSNSVQLGYVGVGDEVDVLGRSAVGEWFFIHNNQDIEGFVYAPRFEWVDEADWDAEYEKLPVVVAPSVQLPTTEPPTTTNPGGELEMDIWPLDGSCVGEGWVRNVYFGARGGTGTYTYYWNGEQVGGPTNEGIAFEVFGGYGAVIGTGRVVSGQWSVQKELFIDQVDCGN